MVACSCHLRAVLRIQATLCPQSRRLFTSASGQSSSFISRSSNFFSDDSEVGSSVYRHSLKFKPPPNIEWRATLHNSVSFIGTVELPMRKTNTYNGHFGVHTFLIVKTSRDSHLCFRILLLMWDEMAEICLRHLRPNDFVYVSGYLGSYPKVDASGMLRTLYKVNVDEINYVAHPGHTCKNIEQSKSGGELGQEKYKNRLHLWHVFFANPYEWRDLRNKKVNPKQPDFSHKDTGEALWLNASDPPWIKRQLQLQDSRLMGQVRSPSRLSPLTYDVF